MQQQSDASRGVAAGLGGAAIGVADLHQQLCLWMAWRFEHDQLIATNSGVPVGQLSHVLGAQLDAIMAGIEHDKIIAETVHLQKRHFPHGLVIWPPQGICPTPPPA